MKPLLSKNGPYFDSEAGVPMGGVRCSGVSLRSKCKAMQGSNGHADDFTAQKTAPGWKGGQK